MSSQIPANKPALDALKEAIKKHPIPVVNKPFCHPLAYKFHQVFANIPINVRKEIIAVVQIDGFKQPMSWNIVNLEVDHNTLAGFEALDNMHKMGLI